MKLKTLMFLCCCLLGSTAAADTLTNYWVVGSFQDPLQTQDEANRILKRTGVRAVASEYVVAGQVHQRLLVRVDQHSDETKQAFRNMGITPWLLKVSAERVSQFQTLVGKTAPSPARSTLEKSQPPVATRPTVQPVPADSRQESAVKPALARAPESKPPAPESKPQTTAAVVAVVKPPARKTVQPVKKSPVQSTLRSAESQQPGSPVFIVAANYGLIGEALSAEKDLAEAFDRVRGQTLLQNGKVVHRVLVGPLSGKARVDVETKLKQLGYKDYRSLALTDPSAPRLSPTAYGRDTVAEANTSTSAPQVSTEVVQAPKSEPVTSPAMQDDREGARAEPGKSKNDYNLARLPEKRQPLPKID